MPTPKPQTVEEALAELRGLLGPMPSFQLTIYVGGREDQYRLSSRNLPCIGGTSIQQCVEQVRRLEETAMRESLTGEQVAEIAARPVERERDRLEPFVSLTPDERDALVTTVRQLRQEVARLERPRMFPIQDGAPAVRWELAEKAYTTYVSLYGKSQSLERLAERGGFGLKEFSCLYLGHDPRCKHSGEHVAEVESQIGYVAQLQQENSRLRSRVLELSNEAKPMVTGEFAMWWICFPCWKAYYVPTSGYFGPCPDCGRATLRWPGDPETTLGMIEFKSRTRQQLEHLK